MYAGILGARVYCHYLQESGKVKAGKIHWKKKLKWWKKYFGGLVALVKELKNKVEKNKEPNENLEISEIV